jgi:hypothetical protein
MEKPITSRSDPESRRAYTRWHYSQNKATYKKRARKKTLETRAAVQEWLYEYLLRVPCVDCGETDPIVLEFDHRPGSAKRFNIGNATSKSISLSSVRAEVLKCDVRCANCHRRKTYERSGFKHRG